MGPWFYSADAGQGLAGEPIDNPFATKGGLHAHELVGVRHHLADDGGVTPLGMGAHGGQQGLGLVRRADGDELALVGDVEGVQTEQLTGGGHLLAHRDGVLAHPHADAGLAGEFIEGGGKAAAGGIAQAVDVRHRGDHGGHQVMQGGGIGADLGAEAQVLALGHHRHPVVAEGAAEQDGIAGPGPVPRDVDALRHHPQAGGGDEEAVRLAPLHHLGVTRHHRDAGLVGGPGHALHHPGQVGQGEAFLQDEARRQVEGAGAGHGDVIDGAVDGQAAYVATGEEEG